MLPSRAGRSVCLVCLALAPATSPAWAESPAPKPPAALECLARDYAVTPVQVEGRWFARLPDGTRLPWDDGKPRTFDEKLEHPDVKDAFSIRYRPGAIRPVTEENDDPGRIRLDVIFQATYPTGRGEMTTIRFLGKPHEVHNKVAARFAAVEARLRKALAADPRLTPFLDGIGGTFVKRNIAGTNRPSAHSYGVSMDINANRTEYWRWQKPASPIKWANKTPQAIVDAFEAEGFVWGGRWYHYDTMHFEYRPELLDEACYR